MANIMINSECNLRCHYCFVSDFNYDKANNMTYENFVKAVNFITKGNNKEQIGVIGGEPLLHPDFDKMMKYLTDNEKVDEIIVFTNGILLDQHWDSLSSHKIKLLINSNSESIMGKYNYEKFKSNLEQAVLKKGLRDKIALGLNIYDEQMAYDYIFDLLSQHKIEHLRLSITVPNRESNMCLNSIQYYSKMKPITYEIITKALERGIIAFFDCNKMPLCTLDHTERIKILSSSTQGVTNVILNESECYPIIDILQDLSAIRCFGISEISKVDISDFKNIRELRNYYMNEFDDFSHIVMASDKCQTCDNRKVKKCNSGCLSYKIDKIIKVREAAVKEATSLLQQTDMV